MKLYPKHCRELLLDLGKKVVAMFDRFDVEYIMAGGTLLGAYRNRKFIPWDYDIDFELLPGELNLINLRVMVVYANAHKEECGFVCLLQHLPTTVKFIPTLSRAQIKKMGLNDPEVINPTVDLCITEPRPGGGTQTVRSEWPNYYYKAGEIYPLQTLEFEGCKWRAPRNPEALFRRYYGDDWQTPEFWPWPAAKNAVKRDVTKLVEG